jgi:hypothetical protein
MGATIEAESTVDSRQSTASELTASRSREPGDGLRNRNLACFQIIDVPAVDSGTVDCGLSTVDSNVDSISRAVH